jgi:hypothetical protein
MVVDQLNDLGAGMRAVQYETDENLKKEKLEKFKKETLPLHFGKPTKKIVDIKNNIKTLNNIIFIEIIVVI